MFQHLKRQVLVYKVSLLKEKEAFRLKLADIYLQKIKFSLTNMPLRDRKKKNSKESQIVETKESLLLRPRNNEIRQEDGVIQIFTNFY